MPATAATVVATALAEVGTTEDPADSNRTRYGEEFGVDGVLWCAIFVWWVFEEAGTDIRRFGAPDPANTNTFDAQVSGSGWARVATADIEPGDVVFFDFNDVDGAGPNVADDNDHVGIAVAAAGPGSVRTVEGNTQPGDDGLQSNGGGVFRRTRPFSLIRHAYRPPYAAWAAQEDDMALDDKLPGKNITLGQAIKEIHERVTTDLKLDEAALGVVRAIARKAGADVDEEELARELAPLLADQLSGLLSTLSDSDITRLASAVVTEQARRLSPTR